MKPLAGFDPLPSADWPEIAAGLARPWSDAACRHDLRWHAMQERVHGKRFPGRPYFMGRWTRPEWDVRLIFRSDWRDPMYPAKLSSDSPAALQPDSSGTPAAVTANAENTPKSSSRTPAALQPDSGNPPSRGSSSPITDHRSPITGDTHSGGKPPTPLSPASEAYGAWRAAHPRAPTKPTPDARRAVERILVETAGVEHAAVYFAWVELSADEAARRLRGDAPWPDGTVTRRDDLESLSRHIPARLPLALAWEERGRRDAPRAATNSPALDAWLAMLAGRWPTDGPAAAALRAIGGSSAVRARTSFDETRLRDRFLATYDTQSP